MITLKPSKRVSKLTGIDFDTLGWIINRVLCVNLNKELRYSISIHKCRTAGTSFVWLDDKTRNFTIHLDCDEKNNTKYVIESILHEIRHILQHTLFKLKIQYAFRSYKEYYNSHEERDARKFERLGTSVYHMYQAFEKSRLVFEKYKLGTTL
jgi:hypothetical protein